MWRRFVTAAGTDDNARALLREFERRRDQLMDERMARGLAMHSFQAFMECGIVVAKNSAAMLDKLDKTMKELDGETMCHCGHTFLMHRGGDSPARCQRRGCDCAEFKAVPPIASTNH